MNYRHISTEATLKGMIRKDAAWQVISDFTRFPSLMKNVDKVIIRDRDGDEGQSEWYFSLENAPLHWLQQDHYNPVNYEISFESIDGDFDRISGSWKVDDYNGEGIKLDYSVNYHLGIPVIEEVVGDVLQEKMQRSINSMMHAVTEELGKTKRVEERKHPRIATCQYNNIDVNGKEMRLKIINISRQGMMFSATTQINPGQTLFIMDGVIIGADILPNAAFPNKTRAIFQREIRRDELNHVVEYLTTKNIRSFARKLIAKDIVFKVADKFIPVHLIDISQSGMMLGNFNVGETIENTFEIEGVPLTPARMNYNPWAKTLKIQYASTLSEKDYMELLTKLECINASPVVMQIA